MSTHPTSPATTLERDPVCGMNVNAASAKHIYRHEGKSYYFCCAPCLEKFKAEPAKYLNQKAPTLSPGLVMLGAATANASSHELSPQSRGAYVCPMFPGGHESKPRACPSARTALQRQEPLASTRTDYTCPMQ